MKTNYNILENLINYPMPINYIKNNKEYQGYKIIVENDIYIYSTINNVLYKSNEVFIYSNNPNKNILN